MLSVRLVSADHYMTTPTPNLDVIYSEFRGSEVKQVAVIRVFGTTITGQKICLHVHGVFPYMYVPYEGTDNPDRMAYQLATSLDKALNISRGSSNATTQHVYKVVLVSGIPFYGYHYQGHQFFKIYFYNPFMLKKASELLQNGAVLNRIFQPHEAHLSFVPQFMIDFSLHGMSMMHLAHVWFRQTPENPSQMLDIPKELLLPEEVARMSTCELEADGLAADIMNRTELFSGESAVANPGLVAIWEDERERRRREDRASQPTPPISQERHAVRPTESDLFYCQRLQEHLLSLSSQVEAVTTPTQMKIPYPAVTPEGLEVLEASCLEIHVPGTARLSGAGTSRTAKDDSVVDEELILSLSSSQQQTQTFNPQDVQLLNLLEDLDRVDNDSMLGTQEEGEESLDTEDSLNHSLYQPNQPGDMEDIIPQSPSSQDAWGDTFWEAIQDHIPQLDGAGDLPTSSCRRRFGMRGYTLPSTRSEQPQNSPAYPDNSPDHPEESPTSQEEVSVSQHIELDPQSSLMLKVSEGHLQHNCAEFENGRSQSPYSQTQVENIQTDSLLQDNQTDLLVCQTQSQGSLQALQCDTQFKDSMQSETGLTAFRDNTMPLQEAQFDNKQTTTCFIELQAVPDNLICSQKSSGKELTLKSAERFTTVVDESLDTEIFTDDFDLYQAPPLSPLQPSEEIELDATAEQKCFEGVLIGDPSFRSPFCEQDDLTTKLDGSGSDISGNPRPPEDLPEVISDLFDSTLLLDEFSPEKELPARRSSRDIKRHRRHKLSMNKRRSSKNSQSLEFVDPSILPLFDETLPKTPLVPFSNLPEVVCRFSLERNDVLFAEDMTEITVVPPTVGIHSAYSQKSVKDNLQQASADFTTGTKIPLKVETHSKQITKKLIKDKQKKLSLSFKKNVSAGDDGTRINGVLPAVVTRLHENLAVRGSCRKERTGHKMYKQVNDKSSVDEVKEYCCGCLNGAKPASRRQSRRKSVRSVHQQAVTQVSHLVNTGTIVQKKRACEGDRVSSGRSKMGGMSCKGKIRKVPDEIKFQPQLNPCAVLVERLTAESICRLCKLANLKVPVSDAFIKTFSKDNDKSGAIDHNAKHHEVNTLIGVTVQSDTLKTGKVTETDKTTRLKLMRPGNVRVPLTKSLQDGDIVQNPRRKSKKYKPDMLYPGEESESKTGREGNRRTKTNESKRISDIEAEPCTSASENKKSLKAKKATGIKPGTNNQFYFDAIMISDSKNDLLFKKETNISVIPEQSSQKDANRKKMSIKEKAQKMRAVPNQINNQDDPMVSVKVEHSKLVNSSEVASKKPASVLKNRPKSSRNEYHFHKNPEDTQDLQNQENVSLSRSSKNCQYPKGSEGKTVSRIYTHRLEDHNTTPLLSKCSRRDASILSQGMVSAQIAVVENDGFSLETSKTVLTSSPMEVCFVDTVTGSGSYLTKINGATVVAPETQVISGVVPVSSVTTSKSISRTNFEREGNRCRSILLGGSVSRSSKVQSESRKDPTGVTANYKGLLNEHVCTATLITKHGVNKTLKVLLERLDQKAVISKTVVTSAIDIGLQNKKTLQHKASNSIPCLDGAIETSSSEDSQELQSGNKCKDNYENQQGEKFDFGINFTDLLQNSPSKNRKSTNSTEMVTPKRTYQPLDIVFEKSPKPATGESPTSAPSNNNKPELSAELQNTNIFSYICQIPVGNVQDIEPFHKKEQIQGSLAHKSNVTASSSQPQTVNTKVDEGQNVETSSTCNSLGPDIQDAAVKKKQAANFNKETVGCLQKQSHGSMTTQGKQHSLTQQVMRTAGRVESWQLETGSSGLQQNVCSVKGAAVGNRHSIAPEKRKRSGITADVGSIPHPKRCSVIQCETDSVKLCKHHSSRPQNQKRSVATAATELKSL